VISHPFLGETGEGARRFGLVSPRVSPRAISRKGINDQEACRPPCCGGADGLDGRGGCRDYHDGDDRAPAGRNVSARVVVSASHPNEAYLSGSYRCSGGAVLWASVKQGGPNPTAEGSSATVDSWYDTHVPLNCNGAWHRLYVQVTKEKPNPGHPANYVRLRPGAAWVQWCVAVNRQLVSSTTRWVRVVQSV
jgi:hypothetical protein